MTRPHWQLGLNVVLVVVGGRDVVGDGGLGINAKHALELETVNISKTKVCPMCLMVFGDELVPEIQQ